MLGVGSLLCALGISDSDVVRNPECTTVLGDAAMREIDFTPTKTGCIHWLLLVPVILLLYLGFLMITDEHPYENMSDPNYRCGLKLEWPPEFRCGYSY